MGHIMELACHFPCQILPQKQKKVYRNNETALNIFCVRVSGCQFLRSTASIAIAIAHISYSNSVHLSVYLPVCPGVTSRYHSKTGWDKDFGFSVYDSLESLAFCGKISCHWVKGIPRMRGERGAPPQKGIILPLLARLTWKWLHIGTDMLIFITNTGDELLRNVNIGDLEWPWTLKIGGFSEFFTILGCIPHFKSELRQNG